MRARMTLTAVLACAALVLAGCGGGSSAGSGSTALGGAAQVVPADAAAFVAIDTDLGSPQWQAVDGLLAKLPARDSLLTTLRSSFEKKTKLSWENDVKPALGPELDLAVLGAGAGGSPQLVVLLQPADAGKLDALLGTIASSGDPKPVSEQVGGWTAVSDSQAALDALSGAPTHLADSTVYQEATGRLAPDALLHAFADGGRARQLLGSFALGSTPSPGTGTLAWASADAVAQDGGLKIDGYMRGDGSGPQPQPYASDLVHRIPSGALLVADFQAKGGTAPAAAGPASPLSGLLGSLGKLGAALGGETAVYLGAGVPLPSVTLVTHSSDPQAAVDALDQAFSGLGGGASGPGSGSGSGGLDLGAILGALKLQHEVVDGNLVVSTSGQAIADFKSGGRKLADDGTFQEAQSASAMPGETTGFLYVNLKDALPLVEGIAAMGGGGLPAGLAENLGVLRTLTAYGSVDGGVQSFTLFLALQ